MKEGVLMKSTLLALGIACLSAVSTLAFATPAAPEMDGDLMGQVSLLIAGVYFVAKASSKK